MVKQKKKRTKRYAGEDSVSTRPSITRVQAIDRGQVGQWYFEKKRTIKIGAITASVLTFISWMIFELVRLAT